ncbi:hypothetical protein U3516DRAFT_571025, partial [Neocallimastix sp. 'constans']
LLNFASQYGFTYKIDSNNKERNYPFYIAVCHNNVKVIKLLIDYSEKNIELIICDKIKIVDDCPVLKVIYNINIDIMKLLIDYFNPSYYIKYNIDKYRYNNYLLLKTIYQNNIKVIKLLIDYSNKHNIILIVNYEKDKG